MSTGEGGMLVTNEKQIAEHAKLVRSHGMATTAVQRRVCARLYDVLQMGYKDRFDDTRAGSDNVQRDSLREALAK